MRQTKLFSEVDVGISLQIEEFANQVGDSRIIHDFVEENGWWPEAEFVLCEANQKIVLADARFERLYSDGYALEDADDVYALRQELSYWRRLRDDLQAAFSQAGITETLLENEPIQEWWMPKQFQYAEPDDTLDLYVGVAPDLPNPFELLDDGEDSPF